MQNKLKSAKLEEDWGEDLEMRELNEEEKITLHAFWHFLLY